MKSKAKTFSKDLIKSLVLHPLGEPFEDHVMRVDSIPLCDQMDPSNPECTACAFKLTVSTYIIVSKYSKCIYDSTRFVKK